MFRFMTLICVALFSLSAMAQVSHTTDVSVTVEWRPLTIAETQAPSFGSVIIAGTQASIISTGTGLISGDAELQGATQNPTYTVTGQPNTTVDYLPPNSATLVNESDSSQTMSITDFGPRSVSLDADGNGDLSDGLHLNVGVNQAPGLYSGSYEFTVAYQ